MGRPPRKPRKNRPSIIGDCVACGGPLAYSGNGTKPKYCEKCDPNPARGRATNGTRATSAEPPREDTLARQRAKAQSRSAEESDAPTLIAMAQSIEPDAAKAARLIGMIGPGLEEWIKAAEEDPAFEDYREGNLNAVGHLSAAMAIFSRRLLQKLNEFPATSLPTAIKALAQAIQISGGADNVYSPATVVYQKPEGAP